MFFHISKQNFNHQILEELYTVKNFFVGLDSGWQRHNDVFFKGYATKHDLLNKVKTRNFSPVQGSYCILDFTNNFNIHVDTDRSFPISFDDDFVTNIPSVGKKHAYIDGSVSYQNNRFEWVPYSHTKFSAHPEINFEQCVDITIECLLDYFKDFVFDKPIYCGDTQGVDTGVLQSVMDYLNIKYTTGDRNISYQAPESAKQLGWGFKNNIYIDNTFVVTGYYGDEFVLRNPGFVNYILSHSGIDLNAEFDKRPDCYMKVFYDTRYRDKITKQQDDLHFDTLYQARYEVYNIMVNDNQIWHYGNTLNLIPFRNFDMARILLHADCDTIIKQVTQAEINKTIIERLSPTRLDNILKYKNTR